MTGGLILRTGIADRWYLNLVWGIIFIVLLWLRSESIRILLSILVVSLVFTVLSYFGELMTLKASLVHKHPRLILILKRSREIERIANIGILILNLIAYFVLWFVLPIFARVTRDVFVRGGILGFFLLVIYLDFVRTGRELAKEKFLLELTEDELEDIEEMEVGENIVGLYLFTFLTNHRLAGQVYMGSLLILTVVLVCFAIVGAVGIWAPIAVFLIGLIIEVVVSLVCGSHDYHQQLKSRDVG